MTLHINCFFEGGVPQPQNISLVSDKDYFTWFEQVNFTATVTDVWGDPISGLTVGLYGVSYGRIGNMVDNGDGTYSGSVDHTWSNEEGVYAKIDDLSSEIISVQYYEYYNEGDNTNYVTVGSGATFTSNGTYITATSNSGEKYANINAYMLVFGDWEFSFEIAENGVNEDFQWQINNKTVYGTSEYLKVGSNFYYFDAPTPLKGKRVAIRYSYLGRKIGVYIDDVLMASATTSLYPDSIGWFMNANGTQYYKNIVIDEYPNPFLITDKFVLSDADSERATLTVMLPQGSGKTVQLFDASDDSLIGPMTDINNGKYTYIYQSQGAGDVSFYAKYGDVSSGAVAIKDYLKYDDATTDKSSSLIAHNLSITHNTDEYQIISTSSQALLTICKNLNDYEAEFDFKADGTGYGGGAFNYDDSIGNGYYFKQWGSATHFYTSNQSGSESQKTAVSHSRQSGWYHCIITKQGNSVNIRASYNGTTYLNRTETISTTSVGLISHYNNVTAYIKNIIIKPL